MSRTIIEDRNCKIDVDELRPMGDFVIIRVIEKERTTGGIILTKAKGTELCVGEVVRAGPGGIGRLGLRYPIELVPGDIVFTMGYIGERMELRTGEYRFVRDSGIWARIVCRDAAAFDFSLIAPRLGNVVIRPRDETKTMSGLLYHPNGQNKDAPMRLGEIVIEGPGIWNPETGKRVPTQVKAGDGVLFTRYAGAEVSLNGEKVRIMNETDVKSMTEGELCGE